MTLLAPPHSPPCMLRTTNALTLLFLIGKDGLESGEDGTETADLNPFPENEIDDMRAVRDAALARYIQVV